MAGILNGAKFPTVAVLLGLALASCQTTTATLTDQSAGSSRSGDFSSAERGARAALGLAEEQRDRNEDNFAVAVLNLGVVLTQAGKLQEARALYDQHAASIVGLQDLNPTIQAQFLLNRGLLALQSNEPQAAADFAVQARDVAIIADNQLLRAAAQNNAAEAYLRLGDFARAGTHLDAAAIAFRQDRAATLSTEEYAIYRSVTGNRARLAWARQDPITALGLYEALLNDEVSRFGSETLFAGLTENNMATILADVGEPKEAERRFLNALTISDRLNGSQSRNSQTIRNNLASVLSRNGRGDAALELLVGSEASTSDPALSIQRASIRGQVLYAAGDVPGALAAAELAASQSTSTFGALHPTTLTLELNTGETYRLSGQSAKAEALYTDLTQRLENAPGRRYFRMRVLVQRGELALARGKSDQAVKVARAALSEIEATLGSSHPLAQRTKRVLAEALLQTGDADQAASLFAELLRTRADRGVFRPDLVALYLRAVQMEGGTGVRPGYEEQAIDVLQYVGTSSTGKSIAQMATRLAQRDDALGALLRDRQDLQGTRDRLEADAVASLQGDDSTKTAAIRTRLQQVSNDLERVDARISDRFPDFDGFASSRVGTVAATQTALSKGEAVLGIVPVLDETWIWAVSGDRLGVWRSSLSTEVIGRLVVEMRYGLDPLQAELKTREGLPRVFPAKSAHQLYRGVFAPARSVVDSARIVNVIAGGAMQSIPFEVLPTELPQQSVWRAGDYRSAPWLIRRHAFVYLPTLAALSALRQGARTRGERSRFLGVGDPLLFDHPVQFGAEPMEQRALRGSSTQGASLRASAAIRATDVFGAATVDPDAIENLVSLPETALELALLGSYFAEDQLMLRSDATEEAVRVRSDLDDFNVLAFATHGLVTGELPGLSEPGLVMTPPKEDDETGDGLLAASEIATLELDADWVILSACNTGASDGTPNAEGLSGMARAFFFAGARSLLVSHWAVVSEPTVELTTRMLQYYDEKGLSKAEALRESILSLLNSDIALYNHPAVWAPFVVVGDGGPKGVGA